MYRVSIQKGQLFKHVGGCQKFAVIDHILKEKNFGFQPYRRGRLEPSFSFMKNFSFVQAADCVPLDGNGPDTVGMP